MKNKNLPILGIIVMLLFSASTLFSQITVTSSVTDATCIGNCDGMIDITPVGGVGNYTYLWSNAGEVTQNVSGLCQGSYTVTVTEDLSSPFNWANPNTGPNHSILIPGSSLNVDGLGFQVGDVVGVFYDSLGFDACGGYIEMTATYINNSTAIAAWGDDSQTAIKDGFATGETFAFKYYRIADGQVIDLAVTYLPGLDTPTYQAGMSAVATLTGTSATALSATHTAVVGEPVAISTTASTTNISTFGGSDGAINLTVINGVSPFTFLWTGGLTDQNLTGLSAGTYDVTVTDANDCTGTGSYLLTEPSAVTITEVITDVTCFGGSDGQIALTISGGASPYAVTWAGGQETETISGLVAGGYNVTVVDDNGATTTGSYNVSEAAQIGLSATSTDVDCNGNSTGAIDLLVANGAGTLSYNWEYSNSTFSTDEDLMGLASGQYFITVTDGNSCTASSAFTVTEPGVLGYNGTLSDYSGFGVSAFGASDGAITLTVSGGTPNFTFSWLHGSSDQNLTGLAAGQYDLTITDDNMCTTNASFTLTEPANSGLSVTGTSSDIDCFGDCTGTITLTVSGGLAPYTYLWSNNATTANLADLCDGTYSVTVTDDSGTSTSYTFDWATFNTGNNHTMFIQNTVVFSIDGAQPVVGDYFGVFYIDDNGEEACGGLVEWQGVSTLFPVWGDDNSFTSPQKDGFDDSEPFIWKYFRFSDNMIIDLTATYLAPYSFPGIVSGGAFSASGGFSGVESLTGVAPPPSSANQGFASFTLTEPPEIVASGVETDVSCISGSDGSIALTVSGGTPSYTYLWSNGEVTEDVSGLVAGNYDVVITDNNNCTLQLFFVIDEPTAIDISGVETMVTCYNGSNGAIALTVSGGTPSYTYLWSGGEETESITGISAGTHTVTVTDANNCTASMSFTITEATQILITGGVTNLLCNGTQSGAIEVSVSGGTPTYTYAWTGGLTDEDISGLAGGSYELVVTDNNSCTNSVLFSVNEPDAIVITGTATNVACNGASTGAVAIDVTGGTGAYDFLWTGGLTDEDISSLLAGTYEVIVTDINGCTATESFDVTEATAIVVTPIFNNISCFGLNDGSIMLSVMGGVPSYTYAWDTGDSGNMLNNLIAGTYVVTVTDVNSCEVIISQTLTQPALLEVTGVATDLNCYGTQLGAIEVSVVGGTQTYSYEWATGELTEDLAGLSGGTYTISVTDASQCMTTETFDVIEPAELTVSGLATDVLCFGGNDGSLSIDVMGGTPGYTFAWTGGLTDEDISGLVAGDYTVVVTDMNSCTATETFTVGQPAELSATAVTSDISCNGLTDGSIVLTVLGGTMDYGFAWDNNETTQNIANLSAGTYVVTITDANGCNVDYTYTINEPALLELTGIVTDLGCYGTQTGAITTTVVGGTMVYTYLWNDMETTPNRTGLSGGTFELVVTDNHGCQVSETFVVVEPSLFIASGVESHVSCNGGSDGSIELTVEGGVPAYSYNWDNGATIEDLTGLTAGTYQVIVYDLNNCPAPASFVITEPDMLTATATISHISCNGLNDGAITIVVSGGTADYTYLWDNTSTMMDQSGLGAGDNTLTITDANGCTFTDTYTINEPAVLELTGIVTDLLCNGTQAGAIDITVAGGTSPYNYLWDGGSMVDDQTGLSGGTYSVTVTDNNGCQVMETFVVFEPEALELTVSMENVSCFGGNDGELSVSVMGGTSPFDYAWSNNETTSAITGLIAGSYTIVVTDANGCVINATYSISEPAILTATAQIANVDCFGGNSGSILVTVIGGTAGYGYTWSNSYNNSDNTGLIAGNYDLTITDANGCTFMDSYVITEPATGLSLSTTVTDVTVLWGSDGAIDLSVSGGVSPYGYSWDNGLSSEDLFGLQEGTYSVVVTDANGCVETTSTYVNQPPSSPAWTFTNTGINHTILIPSNADLNIYGNTLVPGDYIGLFYDSLGFEACGGFLEYTGNVAAIAAWGAQTGLVDGFADGEEFKWKVWVAQSNTYYNMDATYIPAGSPQISHEQYFASNGQSAITQLTVSGGLQLIPLTFMWNIISSYLIPADASMSAIFANNISNISIVKNEDGAAFWPAWGLNMIGDWVPEEGYKVYAYTDDVLAIEGEFINPTTLPINLSAGWSLFAYTRVTPADAVPMLAPVAANINMIKSQDGWVYWPAFGLNAIGDLIPGEGYAAFMSASSTLYYPANSANIAKSSLIRVSNEHYGYINNTGENMTIGLPLSSWNETPNYKDEIAVYNNLGHLVGKGVFTNEDMAIAVWGDDSELDGVNGMEDGASFSLVIWNKLTGNESVLEISWIEGDSNYETNEVAIAGKVVSINNSSFILGQNTPNPVKTTTEIQFSIAKDCNVEISIYNILGDKLEVLSNEFMNSGNHTLTFDASTYATGTYIYRIEAGEFVASKQMNIIK